MRTLLIVATVWTATLAPVQAVHAEALPSDPEVVAQPQGLVRVGTPRLTVYPLGNARVEVPVENASFQFEAFWLRLTLLRADGSFASRCDTDLLRLPSGQQLWTSYLVREALGASRVVVEISPAGPLPPPRAWWGGRDYCANASPGIT